MSYSIAEKVAQEAAQWKRRICESCGKPMIDHAPHRVQCDECVKLNKGKRRNYKDPAKRSATQKRFYKKKRQDPAFIAKERERCRLYREKQRAKQKAQSQTCDSQTQPG